MVYYTIYISTESHYLTSIVTEFEKFRYNKVPMRLCASGDIFQAKVDELLSDIEGFKTYIDDILVLGKRILSQHIYELIFIFARLHNTAIKVNASRRSFGLK